ncbi:hypothetical protein SSU98_1014 [Streptococcus suis 98HAH33]|nr:hypothetical protein SSU05_1001 [Streptococcus suis 05ZYH33]ABP92172.1 hypothetical protein SSU98_1014 [Streptococcus suis 98HAH33]
MYNRDIKNAEERSIYEKEKNLVACNVHTLVGAICFSSTSTSC